MLISSSEEKATIYRFILLSFQLPRICRWVFKKNMLPSVKANR
ncbi:Uncharacterized protein APZ42_034112 [Daphnia magna]|uniref:Uncharacterized protein n=1 Tax=Daphnia magna TaxID=35525 RepID=A0A164KFM5_9CRUS|nr:Uncharacterized protein APZ42_034112 [Daphnia magna]